MALTPRQRQFYQTLLGLYRRHGRSVHYSAVARALGVSPFSAYDMLKLLEGKGVVASEYVLEAGAPGPGRSAIMFLPRGQPTAAEEAEWSRLLDRLREVRDTNIRDVLSEMLARLSEYASPLTFCAGAIATLLVNLRANAQAFSQREQLRALRALLTNGDLGLGTLAGLSVGASLSRLRDSPLPEPLLAAVRRFQSSLATLSAESRQRLADFMREALSAIEAGQA